MEYGCMEGDNENTFEFCYNCQFKMDKNECQAYRDKHKMTLTSKEYE